MKYFRLKATHPGVFTRYTRNRAGERLKALVFTPGRPTAVLDEDAEAVASDVEKKALEEIVDPKLLEKYGFDYANPGDAPAAEEKPTTGSTGDTGSEPPPVAEAATDVEVPTSDTAPPAVARRRR